MFQFCQNSPISSCTCWWWLPSWMESEPFHKHSVSNFVKNNKTLKIFYTFTPNFVLKIQSTKSILQNFKKKTTVLFLLSGVAILTWLLLELCPLFSVEVAVKQLLLLYELRRRWLVLAKSALTEGSWESGDAVDTYCHCQHKTHCFSTQNAQPTEAL